MTAHRVTTLCGSLRHDSWNRKLMSEAVRLYGEARVTDGDLRLPLYDGDLERDKGIPDKAATLAGQIAEADAVIIASPEYNQSVSGVLKNALDWISRVEGNPWLRKPVALMSANAGRAGGARGQYALRLCLTPFRPVFAPGPEVLVAAPAKEFGEDGRLASERYLKALEELERELRALAG